MLKRVMLTVLAIMILVIPVANASEIDLSSMPYSELLALKEKVGMALWKSADFQEVTVPAGLYQVGVEIPSGQWTVTKMDNWARIKIGSALNETQNEVDHRSQGYYTVQVNNDVPSQTITFVDGMYVEIYNAGLVFSTPTGASFSFK